MDRRRAARAAVGAVLRVARGDEIRLPPARTVDVSTTGVLVSFDEPVGFALGQTVVATFGAEPEGCDRQGHVIGRVRRSARGLDFHTYVAIEFDDHDDPEVDAWVRRLLDRHAEAPRSAKMTGA